MAILGRLVRLTLLAFVGVTAVSAVLALQRKRDAPPRPDADADEIELVAIFDELDFRSESQAFRGGRVERQVRKESCRRPVSRQGLIRSPRSA